MKNEQTLFKPIQNKRTFEEISSKIKELVFKGLLKPGDKLPSENELARQYGVGRQTVREALRLLEISGFISIQKGGNGGAIIDDTILTTITKSFVDAIHMKKLSMDAVNAVRIELELPIIRFAAKNADEDDFKSLQKNIQEARKKLDKGIHARKENLDFHKLLARATKNHVFVIIMESIMAVLAVFLSRYQLDLKVQKFIVEEHQKMLDALRKNEPAKACNYLEEYLMVVQDSYKDITMK
jgi:DNA-binding FadR family transcriptional regulator